MFCESYGRNYITLMQLTKNMKPMWIRSKMKTQFVDEVMFKVCAKFISIDI